MNGATVVLVTEKGDFELTGSSLYAADRLNLASAGDIRIEAGERSGFDESYERKSSMFSGSKLYSKTEDLEGRAASYAVRSEISAGQAAIEADGKIELSGVEMTVKTI